MMAVSVARIALVLVAALVLSLGVRAADPPLELKWVQLMPPRQAAPPIAIDLPDNPKAKNLNVVPHDLKGYDPEDDS